MPPTKQPLANSTVVSSAVMCVGLAITYLLLPEDGAIAIYRTAAIGTAFAICLGLFFEVQGVRSLIRVDLCMLVALFGLTLLEFLFPQGDLDQLVTAGSAIHGVEALFLGFGGLIIGRNVASKSQHSTGKVTITTWSPRTLFRVFLMVFFLGYLNMLVAVGFNPLELIHQMLAPRFSQPWTRGSLGNWNVLLGEFSGLLLYLVPAMTGSILAHTSRFSFLQKAVAGLALGFTLFYGFSTGTRNVFCVYLVIFIASYVLQKPNISWKRVIVLSSLAGGLLLFASYVMLQFRTVGLEDYVEVGGDVKGWKSNTLFIDNNLPVISQLTEVFPRTFDYLGLELASFAILHPVPRALWPSKPERLSVSTEDALGISQQRGLAGLVVSSSFVGEAYMMGGYAAVFIMGLLFGALAGWWNRRGLDLQSNTSIILYASGFFAAMISMRSLLWTTTAILPSLAIWLYVKRQRPRMQGVRRVQPMGRKPGT